MPLIKKVAISRPPIQKVATSRPLIQKVLISRPARLPFDKDARRTVWLRKGAGKRIAIVHASSLRPVESAVDSQSGWDFICSYNWVRSAKPTIYVPGAPPKWTPHAFPKVVPKDSGRYYIDQNASKCPKCPFSPLLSALRITRPSFSFDTVDLLVNRASLRNLLSFARNSPRRTFRVDLSLVGNTLIMARREHIKKQRIRPSDPNHGWGHNFESAFTKASPGLENANGHHRAVQYHLGDLNCVVQCEVDAWYDPNPTDEAKPAGPPPAPSPASPPTPPPAQPSSCPSIPTTLPAGHPVPSSRLAEIKSVSGHFEPGQISRVMPQVWFGRTPYLITGRHKDGTFDECRVREPGAVFAEWEKRNQDMLRKLVGLVRQLREIARGAPGRACAVVCDKAARSVRLDVFELGRGAERVVVPGEFLEAFWGGKMKK